MSSSQVVAYVRAENAIFKRGALSLAAYLAANGQSFKERALRLGQLALTGPALSLLGQTDRKMANRATYVPLRGMSEDRLRLLSAEYAEDVLRKQVRTEGVDLIKRLKKEGKHVVLLSEQLRSVVTPVLQGLRLDSLDPVANDLEIRNSRVTGALVPPIVGGHDLVVWAKAHAESLNCRLEDAYAYGSHGPDLLLLAAVGNPVAVNPDYPLKQSATDAQWPVLNLH